MFEQEQLIRNRVALPHLDQLLLKLHPVLVRHEMKAVELARSHAQG
jgi:hypothetical protein